MSPLYILVCHFIRAPFYINYPSTPRSTKWSFVSDRCTSVPSHVCCMCWCDVISLIRWKIQSLNLLLRQFTTVLCLQQRFTCSCRYSFCRYRQIFMEIRVWENLLPASFGIEDCSSGVFQNAANRLPYSTISKPMRQQSTYSSWNVRSKEA